MIFLKKLLAFLGSSSPPSSQGAHAPAPSAPASGPANVPVSPAAPPLGPRILAPEDAVSIPLKAVTDLLPPSLTSLLRKQPSEHVHIQLPRALLQPQLASGAVRITFSQLCEATPPVFFQPGSAPPDTSISLPLPVILGQLKPPRRADQRQAAVPESVPSLFSKNDQTSHRPPPPVQPPAPQAPAPEAAPQPWTRAARDRWYSTRRTTSPGGDPTQAAPEPAARPLNGSNGHATHSQPANPPAALRIAGDSAGPISAPAPAPVPSPTPVTPAASAAEPTAPIPEPIYPNLFSIPLTFVLPALPEDARAAIESVDTTGATIQLPFPEVDARMRTGKLVFAWDRLRQACSHPLPDCLAGETPLDLPLEHIVPLYLASRKVPQVRGDIKISPSIPDLFSRSTAAAPAQTPPAEPSVPAPEESQPIAAAPADPEPETTAVPAPEASVAPAPAPVAPPPAPAPPLVAPAAATPVDHPPLVAHVTQPTRASAPAALPAGASSPFDLIQYLRSIDFVTGAYIATSDGLVIAADTPGVPEMLLAAFAPTAFVQLTKYSNMVRLGTPIALDLHLPGLTLNLRKAGSVYLGVLILAGHAVPEQEIAPVLTVLQQQTL